MKQLTFIELTASRDRFYASLDACKGALPAKEHGGDKMADIIDEIAKFPRICPDHIDLQIRRVAMLMAEAYVNPLITEKAVKNMAEMAKLATTYETLFRGHEDNPATGTVH